MFFGPQAGVDTSAGDFEYEIVGEHPITDLWNVVIFEITAQVLSWQEWWWISGGGGNPTGSDRFVAGALRYSLIIADEGATGFAETGSGRRRTGSGTACYLGYHELTVVPGTPHQQDRKMSLSPRMVRFCFSGWFSGC